MAGTWLAALLEAVARSRGAALALGAAVGVGVVGVGAYAYLRARPAAADDDAPPPPTAAAPEGGEPSADAAAAAESALDDCAGDAADRDSDGACSEGGDAGDDAFYDDDDGDDEPAAPTLAEAVAAVAHVAAEPVATFARELSPAQVALLLLLLLFVLVLYAFQVLLAALAWAPATPGDMAGGGPSALGWATGGFVLAAAAGACGVDGALGGGGGGGGVFDGALPAVWGLLQRGARPSHGATLRDREHDATLRDREHGAMLRDREDGATRRDREDGAGAGAEPAPAPSALPPADAAAASSGVDASAAPSSDRSSPLTAVRERPHPLRLTRAPAAVADGSTDHYSDAPIVMDDDADDDLLVESLPSEISHALSLARLPPSAHDKGNDDGDADDDDELSSGTSAGAGRSRDSQLASASSVSSASLSSAGGGGRALLPLSPRSLDDDSGTQMLSGCLTSGGPDLGVSDSDGSSAARPPSEGTAGASSTARLPPSRGAAGGAERGGAAVAAAAAAAAPAPHPARDGAAGSSHDAGPPAAAAHIAAVGAPTDGEDVSADFAARFRMYLHEVDKAQLAQRFEECERLLQTAIDAVQAPGQQGGRRGRQPAVDALLPPLLLATTGAAVDGALVRALDALPRVRTRLHAAALWRRGRLLNATAPLPANASDKLGMYCRGLSAASASLELFEGDSETHKWMGALLSKTHRNLNEQIGNGHKIREHVLRGLALSPHDPVLLHIMGVWCYEVASLNWVKRQLATAIVGAPPVATYAEALGHLVRSDELAVAQGSPMMTTRLAAARCHQALHDAGAAAAWLRRAAQLPLRPGEDEEAPEQLRRLAAALRVQL